jgi:hypothetical protein
LRHLAGAHAKLSAMIFVCYAADLFYHFLIKQIHRLSYLFCFANLQQILLIAQLQLDLPAVS